MSKVVEKIEKLLTEQIHHELFAHTTYLAMSAFFERGALRGFAKYFRRQATEEHAHAMKFYDYLIERGNHVIVSAVAAPRTEYKSAAEVFRAALTHEQKISKLINAIYEAALAAKDYATLEMLNWFLKEQVEEEDSATEILERVELAGSDASALLLLDHEAAEGE